MLGRVFLATVVASALGIATPASAQDAATTAFVNVNVIPMDSDRVLRGQTVVIEGETIVAVGLAGEVAIPAGAEVIDGNGRYLAPGLADMHMHLTADPSPDFMRLFLAQGITTLRNLNAVPEHLVWREEVLRGERIGPTIYTSGPQIVGPPEITFVLAFWAAIIGGLLLAGLLPWIALWLSRRVRGDAEAAGRLRKRLLPGAAVLVALGIIVIWTKVIPINAYTSLQFPQAYVPDTVERARAEVRRQADAGFDLIKVYDFLTEEQYLAVLDEAGCQGMYVIGHHLDTLTVAASTNSGLREFAHVDEFLDPHMIGNPNPNTGFDEVEIDLEMIPESVAAIVANDVFVVSNLVTDETVYLYLEAGPSYFDRPEYANVRPESIEAWLEGRIKNWQGQETWRRNTMQPFLVRMIQGLHAADVPLLVGTDVNVGGMVPSHIHRELELLVEAGLSPFEALKAATTNARLSVNRMGTGDVFGEVAEGHRADLILLEANPLDSIDATRGRIGVMVRGHWYTQAELDALVAEVAATYVLGRPGGEVRTASAIKQRRQWRPGHRRWFARRFCAGGRLRFVCRCSLPRRDRGRGPTGTPRHGSPPHERWGRPPPGSWEQRHRRCRNGDPGRLQWWLQFAPPSRPPRPAPATAGWWC